MKKLILLFAVLLLLVSLVSAVEESANVEKSYDKLRHVEFSSVFEASLAVLALNNVDTASSAPIIEWIKSQEDAKDSCFPKGKCTVKDTALGIIVLSAEDYPTDSALNWLLSKQTADTEGNLYLQVITENSGKCTITYKPKNSALPVEKTINVEDGQISSNDCPTKSTFFNLGNCLESGLFAKNPSLSASISCRDISDAKLSIVYILNDAYYLVHSTQSNTIDDLTLNTGYFGDAEDTAYANWALKELGSDANSVTWLKKKFNPGNVFDNSMIYIITEQEPYIRNLVTLQNKNTGSFGDSAFLTGLSCTAFTVYGSYGTEVEYARKWLDARQGSDGLWSNKIADTAMALYGCYSSDAVNLQPCTEKDCYPNITLSGISGIGPGISTEEECASDYDCDVGNVCDTVTGQCVPESEECNNNNLCESSLGEDEYNCPSDCPSEEPYCGDSICSADEDKQSCPDDCEGITPAPPKPSGEKGFPWFIVIILLLILFGASAYYFLIMKKGKSLSGMLPFLKKGPKPVRPEIRTPQYLAQRAPQQRPMFRPMQRMPQQKSAVEEELKKSLEEAKKLLKK